MESWSNKPNTMNFVEYGSKNQVLMSGATVSMQLRVNQAQIKDISANGCLVRGAQDLTYTDNNIKVVQYATVFSLILFLHPSSQGLFHIIQFISDHLDLTLVDHFNPHLSTHPIRHPFQPSVSCGSQGSAVQGSSPH